MDESGVVASLAILLMAALVGGMIAHRLRQPIILGYLVIGAAIGPHALGWVSDRGLVQSVATIGVALLMFTLGLGSLRDAVAPGRAGRPLGWGGPDRLDRCRRTSGRLLRLRVDAGSVSRIRHGHISEQHHGLPEDTDGPW